MTSTFDTLAPWGNTATNTPKLLFHIKFTGLTLNPTPTSSGSLKNWINTFSDTSDSSTGFDLSTDIKALWGSSTTTQIQSIPQSDLAADGSDFATYFAPSVTDGNLTLQCSARHATGAGSGNPQESLLFTRSSAQAAANDINEICSITRVTIPVGLDLQVGNTATGFFFEISEFKTGGYGGFNGRGDLRLKLELNGLNGFNEWSGTIDDNANGYPNVPGVGSSTTTFYRNFSGVTAVLGVKTTCYVYFNRARGRLIMAIQPDGGIFSVIMNVTADMLEATALNKRALYGVQNLPFTRILTANNYLSAPVPNPLIVHEYQLWNIPPINLV